MRTRAEHLAWCKERALQYVAARAHSEELWRRKIIVGLPAPPTVTVDGFTSA